MSIVFLTVVFLTSSYPIFKGDNDMFFPVRFKEGYYLSIFSAISIKYKGIIILVQTLQNILGPMLWLFNIQRIQWLVVVGVGGNIFLLDPK